MENNENNCKLLFEWRSDADTNKNSFTQVNCYESFQEKFCNYFKDISPILFYCDTQPIVYCGIYHDNKYQKEYTISIITNPKFRGKGYGKKCLGMAIKYFSKRVKEDIIAEIKEDNVGSIRIFESNGFKFLDDYYMENIRIFRYIYKYQVLRQ